MSLYMCVITSVSVHVSMCIWVFLCMCDFHTVPPFRCIWNVLTWWCWLTLHDLGLTLHLGLMETEHHGLRAPWFPGADSIAGNATELSFPSAPSEGHSQRRIKDPTPTDVQIYRIHSVPAPGGSIIVRGTRLGSSWLPPAEEASGCWGEGAQGPCLSAACP